MQGSMASWPSLYGVLCAIVQEHGSRDGTDPSKHSLLLSQLRPLLESHWHAGFDENALGYRGEDGTFVRLKKMKHLLHAVLSWREQRQAWQQAKGLKPSAVDDVLMPTPWCHRRSTMICCCAWSRAAPRRYSRSCHHSRTGCRSRRQKMHQML